MQSPRIFVTPDFAELPSWFDLFIDFYNFKVCGEHPIYWGRDANLHQRPLGHIQLTNSPLILARWSSISDPFYRTVKATEADYDQWLLYAYDAVESRYLMLDVFGPKAHAHPAFGAYVRHLQETIVQPWLVGRVEAFEPPEDYEP